MYKCECVSAGRLIVSIISWQLGCVSNLDFKCQFGTVIIVNCTYDVQEQKAWQAKQHKLWRLWISVLSFVL